MNNTLRTTIVFGQKLLIAFPFIAVSLAPAQAATSAESVKVDVEKMLRAPSPLALKNGTIQYDKSKWKTEREADGTELLTFKSTPEARAAVLKGKDGELESVTTFQIRSEKLAQAKDPVKDSKSIEDATSVFFKQGQIAAYTQCEDSGDKASVGRICVTATAKLCQQLKAGAEVQSETVKEIDLFEMRALALLLTLRGSDHQLDNMVRSGNRLGLKSGLQTTKGQLVALAKQVAKEAAALQAKAGSAPGAKSVEKVADKQNGSSSVVTAKAERDPAQEPAAAALQDSTRTKEVLEKTLPRLKQACLDTGFITQ